MAASRRPRRYEAFIADSPATVRAAQALRYRVFAEQMGAQPPTMQAWPGLDWDEFDDYCDHLVVVDSASGAVVGTTRLLNDRQALKLGRFHCESQFHIDRVLGLAGRFLEVGRACVDGEAHGGAVIASLWQELAAYAMQGGYGHLMGCAGIPLAPGGFAVEAIYRRLEQDRIGPSYLAVQPKHPVPPQLRSQRDEPGIPPWLKACLRRGAWVCGEPSWHAAFNAMELFVLLPMTRLQSRHAGRFMAADDAVYPPLAVAA
ncbi:hypothetical protein MoryE10_00800 [Methylogaea oryzae]|uniref:GNAT family N-acetyltransferase n=2 Tax=Methylogaea oryzae TaxID=1295382 RepID=A0A8D4VLJ0_9GAMM|nr:hypothetical protein MoryE10_00800 [Methylogaea oryzae]